MLSSEIVLVTGATGTVGRPLVDRLLEAGCRVRALTRDPRKANLPEVVEVVRGNLGDTSTLGTLFDGVGAAHLIGFRDDYLPLTNGQQIVELAEKAGVQRVTRLRGEVEKTAFDLAIEASGLAVTYLSPVEFMANSLEWAKSIKAEGVVRDGFADGKSAPIHEADIAAVAATLLTSDGHMDKEYMLTGPEVLTPREKVSIIGDVIGRELYFVALTQDEMITKWRTEGYADEDLEFFLAMLNDPPIPGDTVLPTVEEVTGRSARTFRRWAQDHAAAFGG